LTRQPHGAPAALGNLRRRPRPRARGRTRITAPLTAVLAALAMALGFSTGPVAASTTSTLVNFTASGAQQQRFDTDGNALDAHDGMMAEFNGTYYLYGTSYNCGYEWQVNSDFCGFKVYSSPDLVHWTDRGFVVPAYSCSDCFRPHVIYDASTQQYVLWTNDSASSSNFRVYTSSSPTGPFTQQAVPTLAFSNCGWDFGLFTDTNGTAYMVDTDCPASADGLIIQQLTPNDLTSDGQYTQVPFPGGAEAPSMFKRGSTYYITMSYPNCGYCTGTGTGYITASNPLGPWTGASGSTGTAAWTIQNGELYANGGGPVTADTGSTWTNYTDSFSTTPLETGTNGSVAVTYAQSGWLVRADNNGDGYGFLLSNYPYTSADASGYLAFVKFAGGQAQSVDPVALPFAVTAGDAYQVSTVVSGDTLTVTVNGQTVAGFTDSSYTGGTIGFREFGTESAYFSDVSVTDLSGNTLFTDDFNGTLAQWNVPEAATTPALISSNSCGGQPSFVSELPQAGGGDVYLYGSDLWDAQLNEGLAGFFWAPLQFSSTGALDQISCSASVNVALADGSAGAQDPIPNLDQTSGVAGFQSTCQITGSADQVMQTFTVGTTGTLRNVDLTAFQETTPTGLTGSAGTVGTPVNAPLTLQLATLNSSGGIGQVLSTQTYAVTDVGWAPENLVFTPDIEVSQGQTYAVVASSSLTAGCYGFEENTANPYSGGNMATSTNSGGSFTAAASNDLKFYTTVVD
jgi:hypothetical protein